MMVYNSLLSSALPVVSEGSTEEPTRAVYEGSISSSILDMFGAIYVRECKVKPLDYLIVRYGQYDYRMYIGKLTSDGEFTGVTEYWRYYGTQNGYSINYYLTHSEVISPSVDVSGYSGYIYSSSSTFAPNPYITSNMQNHYTSYIALALCLGIFAIAIFLWIKNIWETVHHGK